MVSVFYNVFRTFVHKKITMMKNSKNFILLPMMIGMLLFTACEKEGIYNPDKKIAKTTIAVKAIISGHSIDEPAVDEMTYTWEGDQLDNITYCDYDGNPSWSAKYIYDNKNRIIAIENSKNHEKAVFIYDGNKLSEMNFYSGNDKVVYVNVEHDGKRISKLSYHINNNEKALQLKLSPWKFFMDDVAALALDKNIQQVTNDQTKGEVIVIADFVWKGDNVEKMHLSSPTSPTDPNKQVDILFEYDTHINPLLHAYSIYMPIPMRDESHVIHSVNNIIKYQEVTSSQSSSIDFTYTYDGDYPLTRTYSIHDGDDIETYTRAYIYQ